MRALETGRLDPDDDRLQKEASFCLGCRACEPVCPAGVQYGHLLETWRDHQWRGVHRPPLARVLMMVVDRKPLIRLIGAVRRPAQYPRVGTVADASRARRRNGATPDATPLTLMLGCFERGLFPGVSKAVQKLLPEIAVPENQGCCGALHAHNGDSAGGVALAEKLGEELPGVIVTTAGGCAAHLATVLGRDRVHELSEHLVKAGYEPIGELTVDDGHGGRRRARVAIQDSCHLRNGLGRLGGAAGAARGGRGLRVRRGRRLVLRVGRHLLAAAAEGRPPGARAQARRGRGGRASTTSSRSTRAACASGRPGWPGARAGSARCTWPTCWSPRRAGGALPTGLPMAARLPQVRLPSGQRVRRVFRLRKDAGAQDTDGWSA